MPLVFVCPDSASRTGTEFFFPPDGAGAAAKPWCGEGPEGVGTWVDASTLGTGTPDTPAAVTPEQALVQVAMVGSVAFVGLKGLAIGLMR